MKTAILTPAYGRDYKHGSDALKDFNDNMDFIYNGLPGERWDGKPANKSSLIDLGWTHAQIRYNNLEDTILTEMEG